MGKITVTIDTDLHKVVPKSLSRNLCIIAADAGEINGAPMSAFCFETAYIALMNNLPDTLPGVAVHSGDTERLDWLEQQGGEFGGGYKTVRDAIDAAREAQTILNAATKGQS